LKIVHIAVEIAPIAKVGGLGDVVYGLAKELLNQKQDVFVILPFYKHLKKTFLKNIFLYKKNLNLNTKFKIYKNKIYKATLDTIPIYLIEPDNNFFKRKNIYAYKDDQKRFLYFSKVALEFLKSENVKIDILHLHDWHVSFIAAMYNEYYKNDVNIKKIVLSIHNLEYQGLCKPLNIDNLNFDGKYFLDKERLQDPYNERYLNLLKGGIIYSDKIIPVSKTYSHEILTKEYGSGLDKLLLKKRKKIIGIINGIDSDLFSPKKSKHLKIKYDQNTSIQNLKTIKEQYKKILRKKLNLKKNNLPIIANIGRLVYQKGPELIKAACINSKKNKYQFVFLGTPFDKKLENEFHTLKKENENNLNLSLNFKYDEELSHLIFAASDFILIPSKFEPCGLTQIIAFKFGSIPIVRDTGGLADSVFDISNFNTPIKNRNGFVFKKFSKKDMFIAINRALKFYKNEDHFYKLLKKNMKLNYSWVKAAKKYINTYKKLLKN
jgi:starch synthase